MPALYPLWLDLWQHSLKYSNSGTELPSGSVAQLCQAAGSCPSESLSFLPLFIFALYFTPFSLTLTYAKNFQVMKTTTTIEHGYSLTSIGINEILYYPSINTCKVGEALEICEVTYPSSCANFSCPNSDLGK